VVGILSFLSFFLSFFLSSAAYHTEVKGWLFRHGLKLKVTAQAVDFFGCCSLQPAVPEKITTWVKCASNLL